MLLPLGPVTISDRGARAVPWYRTLTGILVIQAVPATNGLPLATAGSLVNVRSSGMDPPESTLLGIGKVTGGLFRR